MKTRKTTLKTLAVAFCSSALCLSVSIAAYGGEKTGRLDTPFISCTSATATTIDVTVSAGATGAPAGFTIQWVTAEDYTLYGEIHSDFDGMTIALSRTEGPLPHRARECVGDARG